jgi:hypothetical protein
MTFIPDARPRKGGLMYNVSVLADFCAKKYGLSAAEIVGSLESVVRIGMPSRLKIMM